MSIVSSIDQEIARLKQVREILSNGSGPRAAATTQKTKRSKGKRTLSPEARKRIADAQRKRWAAQKNAKK